MFPAVYLIASFVAWDFNPGNWDAIARLLVVFGAVWAAVGVLVLE
jgi:hypothetical protein